MICKGSPSFRERVTPSPFLCLPVMAEPIKPAASRLRRIPMFARTPRTLLRPGWPEDATAVHEAINDEAIVRMLARAPWPYRKEDAASWLDSETDPLRPSFLIFQRSLKGMRLIGRQCWPWPHRGGRNRDRILVAAFALGPWLCNRGRTSGYGDSQSTGSSPPFLGPFYRQFGIGSCAPQIGFSSNRPDRTTP